MYGLRAIGKGKTGGETLCGILNLPPPPTRSTRYNIIIGSAIENVALHNMKVAVEEAVAENDNVRGISAAFDGTWQKRGHISLNGVVTATSVDTGKVIDVAILSKHCRCEGRTTNKHETDCECNYSGSSGGVEVAGVTNIFNRSLSSYNVRYVKYLGDGTLSHSLLLRN